MSDIKLKEIKPGMVIHCPTEENAKQLLEYLDGLGYEWSSSLEKLLERTNYGRYGENMCYLVEESMEVMYSDVDYFKNEGEEITEFSDLIEPELTPEEVLSILAEIKSKCGKEFETCHKCPLDRINAGSNGDLCNLENMVDTDKVIRICQQWKANHEKKEPEVELQEAARPLVEYLRKNYHPHATAIVSLDYAEILEGKESAKYGEKM